MPPDSGLALPDDRQRLLQGVFGVFGNPRDPPDRPQHLVLDRTEQGVEVRRGGVQRDTSCYCRRADFNRLLAARHLSF